ncbi:hypothetical protein [Streptomyces pactum]|uniref:hypothetical protein n=1 Tax=Streptomyces pactum TaxID=68249 RepID=UPI0036FFCA24
MTTHIGAHLAAVDALCARALPGRPDPSGGPGTPAGPAHQVVELRASEEFWDADQSRIEEAEEEFGVELEVLVRALAGRWGEPEVLDLTGHLERSALGEPVPPPLDTLCGYVRTLHTWRIPGGWMGVGLAHSGRELPRRLIAAVAAGTPR